MKHFFCLPVFISLIAGFETCPAQVTKDYAVMLTASPDTITPAITLKWPYDPVATGFVVYRKSKASPAWDLTLASLPGSDSSYTDMNIVIDSGYEYQVQKNEQTLTGYGYIYAGIHLPPVETRGKLILLVEGSIASALVQQIDRLMSDIAGDGWTILRHDIAPGTTVQQIRTLIEADYNSDPGAVKSLFMLGHIPVPYSGDLNPDGHSDHKGAWPADVVYSDIAGTYTDVTVFDTNAARPENHNVPGDGKYDQSTIAGIANLESGRVDLRDMPSFILSETELLKRYLDKDHAYRMHQSVPRFKGLIDDQFGIHGGEAFAANGWRNFPVMVGAGNTQELSYFTALSNQSFIWSYACGGGWYQGAGGVGSTTDFANDTILTVFTLLFGSYFGDWDNQDNFLRAPLASAGTALCCAWAGRPNWQFHHMALGETIGYCARLSQNNPGTYLADSSRNGVHVALMGDPTLRLHMIRPVSNVNATYENHLVTVDWTASPDPVLGYYVYRSQEQFGMFARISPQLVTGQVFTDSLPPSGRNYYMVRAMALQMSPSGSYFNLSTGITDSVVVSTGIFELSNLLPGLFVYPNPSRDRIYFRFDGDIPGSCSLIITDVTGRTLLTSGLSRIEKNLSYPLDVSSLTEGLFLLTAATVNGTVTQKIRIIK